MSSTADDQPDHPGREAGGADAAGQAPAAVSIPGAPVLLAAPALAGSGRIGSPVRVVPGLWGGASVLALQWCRDGRDIPGATAAAYVPGADDDGAGLSCRVSAASTAGTATAVTATLPVTCPAPEVAMEPFEEIFDQGSGPQPVALAGSFRGEALRFAIEGAGAGIDPVTGVARIPTDAALSERVTVTARNSGGAAATGFMVTVEAAEPEILLPEALAAADWEVAALSDRRQPGAPLVEAIRILRGPALAAGHLQRSAAADPVDFLSDGDFEACRRHPDFDDPASPFHRSWTGGALVAGARRSTTLRYALEPAAIAAEAAVFSPESDAKLWLVKDGKRPRPEPAPATGGWRVLPALGKAEYEAFVKRGLLSGDNGQYMLGAAQSEAEPDRIYTCQDSGGVWVSLDHGNSWNNLRNRGLFARFTTGIAVDPLDCRRVFVLTQGGGMDAGKHIGLQRSTDGGLSWERVIPNDVSPGRSTQSPIGCAPTSADPAAGRAMRWYCVIQKTSYRKQGGQPHLFYLSDDGGDTWKKVRALDVATFGSIGHLVVSPTDPAVLYINGERGLWRFEAADRPDGAITRLSGKNGLPDGGVFARPYLSADGGTLIAGVGKKGVFRSRDGGASWTEVAPDPELGKLHVNPWQPERMIISYAKGKQLRVSRDGGKSFAKPETVNTGPAGRDNGVISEGSCLVVWHPEQPDRIWAHGGPKHWQSDDGGRNWRPANGYFNGKQHQNWFIDQMFDPADPDRFGYFMTDFGVGTTKNGGLWFDRGRMVTRKLDLAHGTVNGGALHPDPARKIILASVGKMNAGKLVLSQDDGATWTVASDGEERRQYVGFDLDDPRHAYQWRERSTDHGVTWSQMATLPRGFAVSGMTLTAKDLPAGQAIFAIDRDGGGNSRILCSLDRGESWAQVVASPYDFGVEGMTGGGPCRAHPSDPDVFFTKGPNDWTIRRWSFGATPPYVDLNIMGGFPRGVPPDGMFSVMSLALDRRHPEVMYVTNAFDNVPNKFFRTTDGGETWENLTEGFPGVFIRGLEVSPTTGEVFIGTPNGSRVLPPPYAPAGAPAARALAATDTWGQRYLDAAY